MTGRVGYLGPAGTFTHEALLAAGLGAPPREAVPLSTVHDAVVAVRAGAVAHALVPIENSLEGSVNATLDALVAGPRDVAIVGEEVLAIRHCLIAGPAVSLEEVAAVVSHPQALAQCAGFLRGTLPRARTVPASSTAEAVRAVVGDAAGEGRAALGNRVCVDLYGGRILRADVQDATDNATRFAWLARAGDGADPRRVDASGASGGGADAGRGWRTTIAFWGAGATAPGWLVRCLDELSGRGINLTRIESRPLPDARGEYRFFADLDGGVGEPAVDAALAALRGQVEELRVLGSYLRG